MKRVLKVKCINVAKAPMYHCADDAGLDLCASEEMTLAPGERKMISTGISLAIPRGCVGLVWDKSGLSMKHGLKTLGGVVDSGYRGEIIVGMVNLGDEPHAFKKGDKVAQIIIQKKERVVVEEVRELDDTDRGEKGFGSSGT